MDSDMAGAGLQGSWGLEFASGGQGEAQGFIWLVPAHWWVKLIREVFLNSLVRETM